MPREAPDWVSAKSSSRVKLRLPLLIFGFRVIAVQDASLDTVSTSILPVSDAEQLKTSEAQEMRPISSESRAHSRLVNPHRGIPYRLSRWGIKRARQMRSHLGEPFLVNPAS